MRLYLFRFRLVSCRAIEFLVHVKHTGQTVYCKCGDDTTTNATQQNGARLECKIQIVQKNIKVQLQNK